MTETVDVVELRRDALLALANASDDILTRTTHTIAAGITGRPTGTTEARVLDELVEAVHTVDGLSTGVIDPALVWDGPDRDAATRHWQRVLDTAVSALLTGGRP